MDTISSQLKRFRRRLIQSDLRTLGWFSLAAAAVVALLMLVLEAIFWFPISVRYGAWVAGLIALFILVSLGVTGAILITFDKVPRYSLKTCAWQVGMKGFKKKDKVLNALQLETSLSSEERRFSQELARQFIQIVLRKLQSIDPSLIFLKDNMKKLRNIALGVTILSIAIFVSFSPTLSEATTRWIHPRTKFPVLLPFEITSLTGNLSLMGGDNATITFATKDRLPNHILLEINEPEEKTIVKLLPSDEKQFIHELRNVFQNLHYRAFIKASHFWEPWEEISSPVYTIDVIDRPTIERFTVAINPPDYTGLDATSQEGNIAEIRGLKGSEIGIQLKSDKSLSKAYLKFTSSDKKDDVSLIPMEVSRNRAIGKFPLIDNREFSTFIFDTRNIANLDPITYHLMVLEDTPPELIVLQPETYTELGSDFSIPVQLHIEDDFGFSNLQIVYETKHPDFISISAEAEARELVSIHSIDAFSRELTSQDVYYLWNVGNLNLMPEDELRFHFELYDNDEISGPKKAISSTLVARFPSLADLFSRTVEEEQLVQENAETIMENLKELDEALESIELEILKSDKLNWEQQQTLKQSIEEVDKKLEEIEALRERLEEIASQSEKHDLFSNELIDKFRDLNELLQDVLTPELLESMEKIRDAMENLPPEQLLSALQDFRLNTAAIERQLDRFIDIFKRVQAEQKIDELVARMENLAKQQEHLISKLSKNQETEDILRLSEEQERNAKEFKNIKNLMDDASKSMEPYAKMPSHDLRELARSDISEKTSRNMKTASRQLQRQNISAGTQSAEEAEEDLKQITNQLREIRQSFQQQTLDKMIVKFEKALRTTLYISKEQEHLQKETKNVPRNSPRLGETATHQQLLRDQLSQLIQALMQLSRETFAVSPEIGKAIGKATIGMNESLQKLEERNGRASVENQGKTVAALNDAALATLAAIDEMEQSGSASGLEQFMERMRQMADQQQGINEQSLQLALGQMAMLAQEGLIQRLQHQQEQLKKSLEQLMREMRGSRQGGETLSGIVEEMEKVIKDFEKRKVDRRTIERQQRILSRMLDSQRAMKQREFSEKRKGTTAKDIYQVGPSGLPADLGQRRNLAMEALNLALKAGYPRDYQDMIRRYFNSLVEVPEIIEHESEIK